MTQQRVTLYGIPSCDTVKKSRAWLTGCSVTVDFFDLRKNGVPPDHLQHWIDAVGWQPLLNRRGTTWRGLAEPERAAAVDARSAATLLAAHPTLIRRPVIEWDSATRGVITVGWQPERWRELAGHAQETPGS